MRTRWDWCDAELEDLAHLASMLRADFPRSHKLLCAWEKEAAGLLTHPARYPRNAEEQLDHLATHLRQIILKLANLQAMQVYRSPPDHELPKTSEDHLLNFGYERDIRPKELENRIAVTVSVHPGWRGKHLLFSSGQAALQAILLTCLALQPKKQPDIRHIGDYFETQETLKLVQQTGALTYRSGLIAPADQPSDIIIYEPTLCMPTSVAGNTILDPGQINHARIIICDTTLVRHHYDLSALLSLAAQAPAPPLIILMRSGLKLDQAGLELSNVGIVSVFSPSLNDQTWMQNFSPELAKVRTLTGSGLRFEDINALSVPWFLGDCQADFAERVFQNNSTLASNFRQRPSLHLSHAALRQNPTVAPFCLLTLNTGDVAAYRQLENAITTEANRRGLLLQQGGSFGFRGHRYQVITTTQGQSFLRLAIGSRRDHSLNGIIEMLDEIDITAS